MNKKERIKTTNTTKQQSWGQTCVKWWLPLISWESAPFYKYLFQPVLYPVAKKDQGKKSLRFERDATRCSGWSLNFFWAFFASRLWRSLSLVFYIRSSYIWFISYAPHLIISSSFQLILLNILFLFSLVISVLSIIYLMKFASLYMQMVFLPSLPHALKDRRTFIHSGNSSTWSIYMWPHRSNNIC